MKSLEQRDEALPSATGKSTADIRRVAAKAIVSQPGIGAANALAALYANVIIDEGTGVKGIAIGAAMDSLKDQSDKVRCGDLSTIEDILAAQVIVLNQYFIRYMTLSIMNQDNKASLERMLALYHLALKLAEQTRRTAGTLAAIKQPRQTAFVKNLTQNTINQTSESFSQKQSNELLKGGSADDRMVGCETTTASGDDQNMETVDAVDRTQKQ